MKHITRILLFSAPILMMSGAGHAGGLTVTYRFERPAVEQAGMGFSRIVFPATVQAGRAGEPSVPFRGAAVLLPPGERVTAVRVERRGWKAVPGSVRLYPRQDPSPRSAAPSSGTADRDGKFLYRADVYASDRRIEPPAPRFTTRYMRGHAIAAGSFTPVTYNPASGEAGYYSEYEITLETGPDPDAADISRMRRDDAATIARLAAIVDNPRDLPPVSSAAGGGYEYMIVTRESCAGWLAPLRDYHTSRGLRARIMTLEDIEAACAGSDTQEKIRAALTDAYADDGIEFALLAGDSGGGPYSIPHRGLYCEVQSSTLYIDEGIPADLYYASLDGSWNADGDSLFGEPGEEDFYQEIAAGRICFDDSTEAAAIIRKIIMYGESPVVSQCDDALMLGEHLYSDPPTWGGDEMDQLIGSWDVHGFATTGIPEPFDIVRLYDRDAAYGEEDIRSAVNAGTHLVCHAGHSNYTYVMKMTTGDITTANFTNDGVAANFPVINSYGCNAGGFDFDDCIAEEMVSIGTCASAYVGNSRYGWFTEGTTNGPSHHFQREFMDAVFAEGITRLGEANVRSKDETVPFVDLPDEYEPGAHRWCFYALNILGDPAMDIWTGQPAALSASHDQGIDREAAEFTVITDAPAARGTLYAGGTCYGTAAAGQAGVITIPVAAALPVDIDSLDLTVTCHDRLVYKSRLPVTSFSGSGELPPTASLLQNSPNPFNPSTTIRFTLASAGYADLRAYDISGREAAVIASGRMEAGAHEIRWDARDLASGVYFFVLRSGGASLSRKAVLLR